MALLLPTTTDSSILKNNSYAESKIIDLVNSLDKELTKDWIIYYSYYFKGRTKGLSKQYTIIKNHNEIDFLILAPNVGIFVFEIKGGIISYYPYDGWYAMNRYTHKKFRIDPYNQARQNYYGINEILGKLYYSKEKKRYLTLDSFIGGTLIGFPDIDKMPYTGLESDRIDTFIDGMDLYDFIMKNSHNHVIRHDGKILPTKEDIDIIVSKLMGNKFTYSYGPLEYIKSVNLKINHLTEEQETIFSGLLENKRCLVKGRAGTGKTVLCEFLYKHLSLVSNKKVLYLTYNRKFARKIRNDLDTTNGSNCYSVKEYLRNLYMVYISKDIEYDSKIKKKEFLLNELYKYIVNNEIEKYDCLILDEAQDINNDKEIIALLDKSINGGFNNGMCYLFFDDNQTIIKRNEEKIFENKIFSEGYYRYTNFTLTVNCRNGKGIENSLNNLFMIDNDNIDLKDLIVNEDIKYYESNDYIDITKSIIRLINELNNQGISNKSITLLFNYNPKNDQNDIYEELQKFYKDKLVYYDFDHEINNKLTYSSVSKFKGLDNDVIIYINDDYNSKLEDHYVALSRARVYAYIFKLL